MNDILKHSFIKESRFHWDFLRNLQTYEQWEQLAINYQAWQDRVDRKGRKHKIPKVIHQIWLGPKPLPKLYQNWGQSWRDINPGYEYRLWLDEDIKNFGLLNQELYDKTPNYGAKSDLARYEILERLGGIYLDTDFECVAKIPESLLNADFVACLMFNTSPELGNSVIMAAPKSLLLEKVISECRAPSNPGDMFNILEATGPFLLTRSYFDPYRLRDDDEIILPSNWFYPWPNFTMDFNGDPHAFITGQSIGIHHWQTSWFEQPRQGLRFHLKGVIKSLIKRK